jgi:group I intron endonuclease
MYCTIYKATNNINKKIYIGKTTYSLQTRKRRHIYDAKKESQLLFHRALRKYNFDFSWEIIYIAQSKEELKEAEKSFIWLYMSNNNIFGYNLTEGGEGLSGLIFSDEHRRKIGDAHRGEKNYMYGKPYPEERKKLQREKLKGKKISEEIVKRRAETQRGQKREKVTGDKNHFYKEVDDALILKLHNEGKTVPEIKDLTGISCRIIHKRLLWNNLRCHDRFAKKYVDIDLIHLYIQKGLSYKEIAGILKYSETLVSKNYRKSKYYTKPRSKWDIIRIKTNINSQISNQLMN